MAYIGSTPTSGDFVLLDNLTASATASYTMQRNSVNFEPQSANHMIVSLNGTIQKPGSSFTISGSTITFASALTSSDAIDFILVLGNVNDVGVATSVVDSAITKGKLDLISTSGSPGLTVKGDGSSENGTIQLNCSQNSHGVKISSPAHSSGQSYELILPTGNVTADKFLKVASVSGSGSTGIGQLSFADAGGGGFTRVGGGNATGQNLGDLAFDNVFSSTYNTYYCIYRINFVANSTQLWLRVRDGSGYKTNSNYKFILHGENWSETESRISSSGGAQQFQLTGGLGSADDDNNATGYIIFYRPYNSGIVTDVTMGATEKDESYIITSRVGAGAFQNSASLTGFGFLGSNQNIEDYDVTIYGVNQS